MTIAYFDESGDDGYPQRSSDLFVLTSVYMSTDVWKSNFQQFYSFRREFQANYDFPIKQEFHTREFIQDKNPYHGKYSPEQRRIMLFEYVAALVKLPVRSVTVVIDKTKIRYDHYDVLENALTYNIQRIENDLRRRNAAELFLIITDEGREHAMTRIARKLQQPHYLPSQLGGQPYRNEIKLLIEDPLAKRSDESYFIQIADTIAFITMLYSIKNLYRGTAD